MLPVVESKLSPPNCQNPAKNHHFPERPRGERLLLLVAGAGYGKTTALESWYAKAPGRKVWLALDESDSEPVRFWLHLVTAIERQVNKDKDFSLASQFTSENTNLESVIDTLLNLLFKFSNDQGEKLCLFIDDYHKITSDRLLEQFAYFICYLPESVELFISTRETPTSLIGKLRSNTTHQTIEQNYLLFDSDDVIELAKRKFNKEIETEVAQRVVEISQGWVTAQNALLVLYDDWENELPLLNYENVALESLNAFFMHQIYLRLSPAARSLLLNLSVFDYIETEAIQYIDPAAGRSTFQKLLSSNTFIVPVGNSNYKFHDLFRSFLRETLNELEKEEQKTIYSRCAQYYETNGDPGAAISLYRERENNDAIVSLLKRHGEYFVESYYNEPVQKWFQEISFDIIVANPELISPYLWSLSEPKKIASGIELATRSLEVIEQHETLSSEVKDLYRFQLYAFKSMVYCLLDDFESAVPVARQSLALAPDVDAPLYCWTYAHALKSLWFAGVRENTFAGMQDILELAFEKKAIGSAIVASNALIVFFLSIGEFKHSCSFYSRLEHWLNELGQEHHEYFALTSASILISYLMMGDIESIKYHIEKLSLFKTTHNWLSYTEFLIEILKVHYSIAIGEYEEAYSLLDNGINGSTAYKFKFNIASFEASRAALDVNLERTDRAMAWAKPAYEELVDDHRFCVWEEKFVCAKVLIQGQMEREALALIQPIYDMARTQNSWTLITKYHFWLSQMENTIPAEERYVHLEESLRIAEQKGQKHSFTTNPPKVLAYLEDYVKNKGIYSDYAQILLDSSRYKKTADDGLEQPLYSLSPMQVKVLALAAKGLNNKAIAKAEEISPETVHTHFKSIFIKTNSCSRAQAVAKTTRIFNFDGLGS